MIKEAIFKLIEKKDLTRNEMRAVMEEIMTGTSTPAQIGAFLTALRLKGETIEEITGAAIVMREKAAKIDLKSMGRTLGIDRNSFNVDTETIIDTCGTGGSGTNTFNISTTSAFVVAGAGLVVAKHGNRSISSQCGSADVVAALGINIDLSPQQVKECILKVGIGFLYAPLFHGAMKYAIGPRREIGIRTIFNILGPLTNPASATAQVLGVYEEKLCEILANVLKNLGSRHAFVVHGMDALDEITVTDQTKVAELKDNEIKSFYIEPQNFGIPLASLDDIKGGDATQNAQIVLNILKGEKGPRRDVVLLNASAALVAGGKASNLKEGIEIAKHSIDSKAALNKLKSLIEFSQKIKSEYT